VSTRDVITHLRALAARTSDAHGAQRVAWGPVWRDARAWLDEVLAADGFTTERDAAGNNWITLPGARPETVVIGGHLDSVPNGGWLDGPLGVLAGVEALRRYKGTPPPVTLAVCDFADEEGARFSRSLVGSSGASGSLVPETLRGLVDRQGVRFPDALAENGVDLDRMPGHARRSTAGVRARISSCTSSRGPCSKRWGARPAPSSGTTAWSATCCASSAGPHSGSTPIRMRRDAFLAAAETALACREIALAHSTPEAGMVCTVGTVKVEPAIVTAVPGVCEIALDQRALEPATLASALAAARASRGPRRRREWLHGGVASRVAHRPVPLRPAPGGPLRRGRAGSHRPRAAPAVGAAARCGRDGAHHAVRDDVRDVVERPFALQGRRYA
jgi:N-carbamoyl-L-amino-acid hydrolase